MEFEHIEDAAQRDWIRRRFESPTHRFQFSVQEKKVITPAILQAQVLP